MTPSDPNEMYPSAHEDRLSAKKVKETPQTVSPAYRLAFDDEEFLLRDDMRPVRLQLELKKPEVLQQEEGIESTIVAFGSARIPDRTEAEKRLDEARSAARALHHPTDPTSRPVAPLPVVSVNQHPASSRPSTALQRAYSIFMPNRPRTDRCHHQGRQRVRACIPT